MTSKDLVKSLFEQVKEDYQTAKDLFENKHYHYALFFGQLVLEKVLKILIIRKTKKVYPPIHDLKKLARTAKIQLDKSQGEDFDEITSFNIAARYDTEKLTFFRKASKNFSQKWLKKIKDYKLWLESQF